MTGLLAVLGTVAGGVIEGYWQKDRAQQEFQSSLILKALESDDPAERVSSLKFLVEAGLIYDPEMAGRLETILEDETIELPRFGVPIVPRELKGTESGKKSAGLADDEAAGRFYALSGLVVRHGDIVDAVTPIFTEVSIDGSLGPETAGKRFGGDKGNETTLAKPGYLISRIDMIRGAYFGAPHVIHLQITWRKLKGDRLDPETEVKSEQLGSGANAEVRGESIVYEAPDRHYISDILVPPSLQHTSGEVYLTDLVVNFRPLPTKP